MAIEGSPADDHKACTDCSTGFMRVYGQGMRINHSVESRVFAWGVLRIILHPTPENETIAEIFEVTGFSDILTIE